MLTNRARETVGARAIDLAIEQLRITREFFYDELDGVPHYRDFVDDVRTAPNLPSPTTTWLTTDAGVPALKAFLSTPGGAETTILERKILQSIRFEPCAPTART